MKKYFFIILVCAGISSGLHLYLSFRTQAVLAGKAESSSICHINDQLNCDTALASEYSQIAGLHLSDMGFATNLIIALLAFMLLNSLREQAPRILLALTAFSTASASASLVMLMLSLFALKVFCPFCLILYLLSFVILACLYLTINKKLLLSAVKKTTFRFIAGCSLAWLSISLLSCLIIMHLNKSQADPKTVRVQLLDWLSAPEKSTAKAPLLTSGQKNTSKDSIKITEFADFLCSHCKNSYYTLKLLKSSRPDIYVEYYSFPLDQCKSNRVSCILTKAVYCAKQQQQGWNLHHLIFDHQKIFISMRDNNKAIEQLKKIGKHLPLKWNIWQDCISSEPAEALLKEQLKAAEQMQITSTPSLFINNKKINQRHLIPTVQAIKQHLQEH